MPLIVLHVHVHVHSVHVDAHVPSSKYSNFIT